MIYKTLILTGLRKGELASLTVGQLHLDADLPYLDLNAADEKNRQGSSIMLRDDLADDLRQWLAAEFGMPTARRKMARKADSCPATYEYAALHRAYRNASHPESRLESRRYLQSR